MRRFTGSVFERMMTEIPKTYPKKRTVVPPEGHPCHGCKRYGEGCVLPCYRGVTSIPALPYTIV